MRHIEAACPWTTSEDDGMPLITELSHGAVPMSHRLAHAPMEDHSARGNLRRSEEHHDSGIDAKMAILPAAQFISGVHAQN